VAVQAWGEAPPDLPPGDVVVEAFGCEPPPGFVARMAALTPPPLWLNFEYLSAEGYVGRSHGLRSPQFAGPGAGLDKWFFYPGFTRDTGGLLHDGAALADNPAAARAWLLAQDWAVAAGLNPSDRLVLQFGYPSAALALLPPALAGAPGVLLLPPGAARAQLQGEAMPAGLRLVALPYLTQPDFDRLLAATDLNWVRGEDSFVRAQLCAQAPMLWQAYPQSDSAHGPKLEAFLDRYLAGAPADLTQSLRQASRVVNGLAPGPLQLPEPAAWRAVHGRWRAQLLAQTDLCTRLQHYVASKKP
jgi:uncharacterized repeat protein (TIGR03837 family)